MMNELQVFAFVVLPAIVVAIGWTGAWLHMRSLKAADRPEREQQLRG